LQVYPNPVSDNLNLRIELPDHDFLTITLNDVLGNTMGIANHELMYKGLNKITIPVSILSEGTYYIRVITSQGTIVKSVVIF
jgi:hypothetical protein